MDKDMETLDQRLKLIQRQREMAERRKRINIIKYILITVPCLVAVLPIVISLCLMRTVAGMEGAVAEVKAQKGESAILLDENAGINGIDNISDYIATNDADDKTLQGKRVYLTFDDGPSAYTDEILDILGKEEVKACFFVVGDTDNTGTASKSVISSMRRIVNEGHTIGIHSYSHDYSKIYNSLKSFKYDVNTMSDLIFVNTGIRTHLYRFPGGSGNTVSKVPVSELASWLKEEGYIYYDWNAFTGDAVSETISPNKLVNNAIGYIKVNDKAGRDTILLMHDHGSKHNMVEALPKLIKKLKDKGYNMTKPLTEEVTPVQQLSLD